MDCIIKSGVVYHLHYRAKKETDKDQKKSNECNRNNQENTIDEEIRSKMIHGIGETDIVFILNCKSEVVGRIGQLGSHNNSYNTNDKSRN